jgi:hypothetical protein
MAEYTLIQGLGWLKASPSAIGAGLWVKTSDHGIILDDDEIPNLVAFLQAHMSRRAKDLAKAANGR